MKFYIFLIFFSFSGAWGQNLPDAQGRNISSSAHRVISLSPAITELIYNMNLQNKLVGVSEFSDFPKEAAQKLSVGPYTKPNMEKILELHPDLVILPMEGPEDVGHHLEQVQVNYAVVSMKQLNDIGKTALQIASWLGDKDAGVKFKKNWDGHLKKMFNHKPSSDIHVFIEIQSDPLMAVGAGTFIDEMVRRCGGENVTKENGYPLVSKEALLLKKTDVVLLADHFSTDAEKKSAVEMWSQFPTTQKAQIIALDPDTTTRPGPRLIQGIQAICTAISKSRSPHGPSH